MRVLFQDAQTTSEAQWPKSLCDHHGAGFRILLQQFGDGGFKRVQFAGAWSPGGRARRGGQVLGNGSASDVEMTCDPAYRPLLGEVQTMNGVDLFGSQHCSDTPIQGVHRGGLESCSLQAWTELSGGCLRA